MENRTIGVLIQGAGWVSTQHIAAYEHNPHTRIVAINSISVEDAKRRADAEGLNDVKCFADLGEALRHPGVDAVSICTPQHLHCQNVLAAAAAGKDMVIEKPVATSVADLHAMQEAVVKARVKTVVSFVMRWNPLVRTLKSMIADDALGNLHCVESDYLSYNGSWWKGWKDTHTIKQGVSSFLVGGCHAIDAMRWLAAKGEFEAASPVEVYAIAGGHRKGKTREYNPTTNSWIDGAPPMEYDGLEMALVRFDNGVIGKVSVNAECIMPYRFPIRIFGDKGSVFDNAIWSHKYPGQTDWVSLPTVLPDSSDVSHHSFQGEIDHFIECVRGGNESHCNLADAVKTHEVVFAAQECYKTGRPVRLPLS